ncbi:MAG: hypothetical protein H6Q15_1221 [Bacteroidetes bacterium]|nr:hypothetical protein [Bacteroidota bacterium]
MYNITLIPKISVGNFIFGDNISNYLYIPHRVVHHDEDELPYDSYIFDELGITIWVEDHKIESISCIIECIWGNKNLVRMCFDDFLSICNNKPNKTESIYLLVNGRGQNQIVHDFDELGLQIWVWRKKIVTVIAYKE